MYEEMKGALEDGEQKNTKDSSSVRDFLTKIVQELQDWQFIPTKTAYRFCPVYSVFSSGTHFSITI
jgi:hypothetical protein